MNDNQCAVQAIRLIYDQALFAVANGIENDSWWAVTHRFSDVSVEYAPEFMGFYRRGLVVALHTAYASWVRHASDAEWVALQEAMDDAEPLEDDRWAWPMVISAVQGVAVRSYVYGCPIDLELQILDVATSSVAMMDSEFIPAIARLLQLIAAREFAGLPREDRLALLSAELYAELSAHAALVESLTVGPSAPRGYE